MAVRMVVATTTGARPSLLDACAFGHLRTRGTRTSPGRICCQHHSCALDAVDVLDDLFGSLAQWLELGRPVGRHGDREIHPAVLDQDLGHEPQIDEIALHIRTLDPAELG